MHLRHPYALATSFFKLLLPYFVKKKKTFWISWIQWATSWQNQQNGMCAQQRLRSAWASAQSDQSSLSAWISYPLSTQRRLIRLGRWPGWVFAGLSHFVGFVMRWLTAKCPVLTAAVKGLNGLNHEKRDLSIMWFIILQKRMRSRSVMLNFWLFVWNFV